MTDVPQVPGPVRIVVQADAAELVADHLMSLGASAVAESASEDGLVELIADPPLDGDDALTELRDAVASMVVAVAGHLAPEGEGALLAAVSVEPHDEPDPGATWTEHAEVVDVGRRLRVRPEWLPDPGGGADTPDDGRLDVVVAAADAFGSGAHPTTRMCLEATETLVREGDRVLDVGSGSGVLAVAAALLGAGEVRCFDIEPASVAATERSAVLSGVADRVTARLEPVDGVADLGTHDLVLANLLVPIIEQLGPTLVAAVGPDGHLVVSGLLEEQLDRARVACAPLDAVRVFREGGWVALVLGPPRSGGTPSAGV